MASAHLLKRFKKILTCRAGFVQEATRVCSLHIAQCEKQMLCGNELIAKLFRVFFRAIENLIQLAGKIRLRVRLLWIPCGLALGVLTNGRDTYAKLLENGHDDPFVLREKGEEKVQVVHLRIACTPGDRNRIVDRFA
jgi:hypothetical protein